MSYTINKAIERNYFLDCKQIHNIAFFSGQPIGKAGGGVAGVTCFVVANWIIFSTFLYFLIIGW